MAISDIQKKLRRWFRNHGWRTGDTPTNNGFYLMSPVENAAGLIYCGIDPETELKRYFAWERRATIELDRFCCDYVTIELYQRKHWYTRDLSVPDDDFHHSWIPSDDFSKWEKTSYVNIPAKDMVKLAELIQAAQTDWLSVRKSKNHLNFMERISKSCGIRWIGVNSSYDEIKNTYSNKKSPEK